MKKNTAYQETVWNNYAETHLSVLPSVQLEVYRSVARHLEGKVADFGCGTARIAPFLNDKPEVTAYTGIDYSADMVDKARWLLAQLPQPHWKILHGRIEEVQGELFTCGVSINSYYSWDDPVGTLQQIYRLLVPSSPFILVTPNPSLDMEKLAREADKELLGHPHYPMFKAHNLSLAGNERALFIPMSRLVQQVVEVGFKVTACHQEFYQGGLNFLRLER
ncbi:MAG: class I SAM-dependent methyltransferase [Thiolinea sp.]